MDQGVGAKRSTFCRAKWISAGWPAFSFYRATTTTRQSIHKTSTYTHPVVHSTTSTRTRLLFCLKVNSGHELLQLPLAVNMSDTLEPPAKRARLDADGDVPGSPVDDMDDDFYDNPTPVKPMLSSVEPEAPRASSSAAGSVPAGVSSLHLPGLGLLSTASEQRSSVTQTSVTKSEGPGDGDVSDPESIYNEAKPAQANATFVAIPAATDELPTADGAPVAPQLSNGEPKAETSKDDVGEQSAAKVDEAKADFLRAAEANKGNAEAEWELDSQQSDSSSDSSSDDSDDSSEDEGDSDEGELLSPEEQARLLMMETTDGPETSGPAAVRTVNEVIPEVFEKPDITVTESTKRTELGQVESIVGNLVVIKAKTSGQERVLESGSALCLSSGTVIGKIAETLGRIEEPRYSVGFTDPTEIATLGIAKDTKIYYVDEHSTFVYTGPLKEQKFTDASNLHDEEADHVEFSDDEKEAEFKKKQKAMKREKHESNDKTKNAAPHDTQDRPQPKPNNDVPPASKPGQYSSGGLNYDDDDDDLGMYKPLARPDHFEDIVGAGAPLEDRSHVRRGNMRGRGGWPDRGRGFRGRGGAGGMGGGGAGRGNQRGNQRGGGGRFAGVPTGPSGNPDRGGRHQQEHNRGRNHGPNHGPKDNRPGSSASPSRKNRQRHGHGQQQSPRGKGAGGRQGRNASSPPAASASPAPPVNNAYTQNASLSSNAWAKPSTSSVTPQFPAPQPPYATYSGSAQPPPIPAGAYVNPAFYSQPAAPQDPRLQQLQQQQQQQQQPQQQQQQNLAQWAQWIQLAAAMQSQGQPQAQPQQPAQPAPAPLYNMQPSAPQANGTPSLQDILQRLAGGGAPQNR